MSCHVSWKSATLTSLGWFAAGAPSRTTSKWETSTTNMCNSSQILHQPNRKWLPKNAPKKKEKKLLPRHLDVRLHSFFQAAEFGFLVQVSLVQAWKTLKTVGCYLKVSGTVEESSVTFWGFKDLQFRSSGRRWDFEASLADQHIDKDLSPKGSPLFVKVFPRMI